MTNKQITHVAGTFLIEAEGAFLNGAGLGEGEDRNVTIPKTFRDGKYKVPYVSAQAWRRWLRNTLIEETGWPASELKSRKKSQKGTTSKVYGELNPVDFPEDDLFGYMMSAEGQGKGEVKSIMRTSPLSTSILMSLRNKGWQGKDEGFVHLNEGYPLPYTTEFYNSHLQGVFTLDYSRLGIFNNVGDHIELDNEKIEALLNENKIEVIEENEGGQLYKMLEADGIRGERATELLKALSVLRGGAKQAAFGTDVSPKMIVMAGLTSGNPIFNHLFEDDGNGPRLHIDKFQEILADYADRIVTPVFIGLRKGYLVNENEVHEFVDSGVSSVELKICTPVQAAHQIGAYI